MPRVCLFHWKAGEAKPLIEKLRTCGYTVDYAGDKPSLARFRALIESPPQAFVIDLTRMPSRGRYVAATIRSKKSIRSIPIVFVDGEAEKLEKIKAALPDATYASRAGLAAALKRARPLDRPASPPQMMASYGDRTTAQKLGIREGLRVAVINAASGYSRAVGELPSDAILEEDPSEVLPLTLWFVRDRETLLEALPKMRELAAARSKVWVIYPKQKAKQGSKAPASGLTQFFLRESALAVGLVDYKICSVNETWTGMLFAQKRGG